MHKILIVDDEESLRFTLKAAFAGKYEVFVSEGADAVEIVKKERPIVVFLDINMPGLNGVELLQRIQETGLTPSIWMLTGVEELDTVLKALKMGAAGYITKPFDLEQVRRIVADIVSDADGGNAGTDKPWKVKKHK